MERFSAFEDGALRGRLKRLKRAELDLRDKVRQQIARLEAQDRWLRSDPLFQRLSSSLNEVWRNIRDTEQELLRRSGSPLAEAA